MAVSVKMRQVNRAGENGDARSTEIRSETSRDRNFPSSYRLFEFGCRSQYCEQAIHQFRRIENRIEQHQAFARIGVPGQRQQRPAHFPVARETLRSADQPQIELILFDAHVR